MSEARTPAITPQVRLLNGVSVSLWRTVRRGEGGEGGEERRGRRGEGGVSTCV